MKKNTIKCLIFDDSSEIFKTMSFCKKFNFDKNLENVKKKIVEEMKEDLDTFKYMVIVQKLIKEKCILEIF